MMPAGSTIGSTLQVLRLYKEPWPRSWIRLARTQPPSIVATGMAGALTARGVASAADHNYGSIFCPWPRLPRGGGPRPGGRGYVVRGTTPYLRQGALAMCVADTQLKSGAVFRRLSVLDRLLPLWIFLAMGVGLGQGYLYPDVAKLLDAARISSVSLPIA